MGRAARGEVAMEIRRLLLLLLAATIATGAGFLIIIAGNFGSGVGLHEYAALILLILLVGALWAAYGLRAIDPRPAQRVALALGALIVAAGIGAGLAAGAVPLALSGLPLLPLVLMLALVADGIRVSRRISGIPASAESRSHEAIKL
jgi:peptidoglycan/LPS O-acetylase OafA/YrhL